MARADLAAAWAGDLVRSPKPRRLRDYEWPSKVYLHDSTYMMNGTKPDLASQIGIVLLTGQSAYPGGTVPDVLWDGIADPALSGPNPMQICIKEPRRRPCATCTSTSSTRTRPTSRSSSSATPLPSIAR